MASVCLGIYPPEKPYICIALELAGELPFKTDDGEYDAWYVSKSVQRSQM